MGQGPYFIPVRPEDTIPPAARAAMASPAFRAPTPHPGAATGGQAPAPGVSGLPAPAAAAAGGQEVPAAPPGGQEVPAPPAQAPAPGVPDLPAPDADNSSDDEESVGIVFIRTSERLKKRAPVDLRDFAEDAPDADQTGDLTILTADLRYDEDDETVEPPPKGYDPHLSDDDEFYPENDDDLRIEVDELDGLRGDQEEDPVRPESAIEISDSEDEKDEYGPVDFDDPQVLSTIYIRNAIATLL